MAAFFYNPKQGNAAFFYQGRTKTRWKSCLSSSDQSLTIPDLHIVGTVPERNNFRAGSPVYRSHNDEESGVRRCKERSTCQLQLLFTAYSQQASCGTAIIHCDFRMWQLDPLNGMELFQAVTELLWTFGPLTFSIWTGEYSLLSILNF